MQHDTRIDRIEATQEAMLDVQAQQKPYLKIGQRYLPVSGTIHYLDGGDTVYIYANNQPLTKVVDFDAKKLLRWLDAHAVDIGTMPETKQPLPDLATSFSLRR